MATNNVIINRNIENASHSTGPRTDEGKVIASQNSLKHGLASGTLLLPGEDPAAYEALVADFITQHQPETPGEEITITDMAHAAGHRPPEPIPRRRKNARPLPPLSSRPRAGLLPSPRRAPQTQARTART